MIEFDDFCRKLKGFAPHRWQSELNDLMSAKVQSCKIEQDCGMGKTLGVAMTWLYNRAYRGDVSWPRKLVWILPQRVLVEQVEKELVALFDRFKHEFVDKPEVETGVLMGGSVDKDWAEEPEKLRVLIGTEEMIVSRLLCHGYGLSKYARTIDCGLLHHDTLFVCDEVQLLDNALETLQRLQSLRDERLKTYTWYMTATMRDVWFRDCGDLPTIKTNEEDKANVPAWSRNTKKRLEFKAVGDAQSHECHETIVDIIVQHNNGRSGDRVPVLYVSNTRKRAIEVYKLLVREGIKDVELLHSAVRRHDRKAWLERLNNASVIVATQVIEVGVDIDADVLITDPAPMPNLIQRFGRCGRAGGRETKVFVLKFTGDNEKSFLPYDKILVNLAIDALELHCEADVSSQGLSKLKETCKDQLDALFERTLSSAPVWEKMLPLVWRGFFGRVSQDEKDPTVSPYIRVIDDDHTTCDVFWRDRDELNGDTLKRGPSKEETCPVKLSHRDFLSKMHGARLVECEWDEEKHRPSFKLRTFGSCDVQPHVTIVVPCDCGGYNVKIGWDESSCDKVEPVTPHRTHHDVCKSVDRKAMTLQEHTAHVVNAARELAKDLHLPENLSRTLIDAARWHDVGKAHPEFQQMLGKPRELADIYAKSDPEWRDTRRNPRPVFRHEFASAYILSKSTVDDNVISLVATHHTKVPLNVEPHEKEKHENSRNRPRRALGLQERDEIKLLEEKIVVTNLVAFETHLSKIFRMTQKSAQKTLNVILLGSLLKIADHRGS